MDPNRRPGENTYSEKKKIRAVFMYEIYKFN